MSPRGNRGGRRLIARYYVVECIWNAWDTIQHAFYAVPSTADIRERYTVIRVFASVLPRTGSSLCLYARTRPLLQGSRITNEYKRYNSRSEKQTQFYRYAGAVIAQARLCRLFLFTCIHIYIFINICLHHFFFLHPTGNSCIGVLQFTTCSPMIRNVISVICRWPRSARVLIPAEHLRTTET